MTPTMEHTVTLTTRLAAALAGVTLAAAGVATAPAAATDDPTPPASPPTEAPALPADDSPPTEAPTTPTTVEHEAPPPEIGGDCDAVWVVIPDVDAPLEYAIEGTPVPPGVYEVVTGDDEDVQPYRGEHVHVTVAIHAMATNDAHELVGQTEWQLASPAADDDCARVPGDYSPPADPDVEPADDLDCADFDGPVDVSAGDPHGLDADGDGVGCEADEVDLAASDTPRGSLAQTGATIAGVLVAGGLLVAAGVALVLAARRRRSAGATG